MDDGRCNARAFGLCQCSAEFGWKLAVVTAADGEGATVIPAHEAAAASRCAPDPSLGGRRER